MGLATKLEQLVGAHAPWLLERVAECPWLDQKLNRLAINGAIGCTPARPLPHTLWTGRPSDTPAPDTPEPPAGYVSWAGLFDRRFTGRHLPPADAAYAARLPPIEAVQALFARQAFRPSTTTSALLCFFAQWFTDSFLRTHPTDRRRNTSNHEIDMCQIYGLDAETARLLRTLQGGRLKTSADSLFPARLFGTDGALRPEFADLPYMLHRPDGSALEDVVLGTLSVPPDERARRRDGLYATGLERGNSTILYTAISTMFVREHNRLCGVLEQAHPAWDDDRLFETARNTVIAMILCIVVEDYVNHLAQSPFRLSFDASFAEQENWYRTNRISIEFDLLYRWHSLVPPTLTVGGRTLAHTEYRFNNAVLEHFGAEAVIAAASTQPAGRVGVRNTPDFLNVAEWAAHNFARTQRLRPFVEYQARFGMIRAHDFTDITADEDLAEDLRRLYPGGVADVEFLVGLFAQDHPDTAVLGPALMTMVAVDAFSQILTNPLLSSNIQSEDAFGPEGTQAIADTHTLRDVVLRNRAPGTPADPVCHFRLP